MRKAALSLLLLLLLVPVGYGLTADGLVAYYSFDTDMTDDYTGTYNGTTVGSPTHTGTGGVANSGYYTDTFSSSKYMRIGHNDAFNFATGNYTVTIWVNTDTASGTWVNKFNGNFSTSGGVPTGYYMRDGGASDDVDLTQYETGALFTTYKPSGASILSRWNQITWTVSGSNWTLYMNGTSYASGTQTNRNFNNTAPIIFGVWGWNGGNAYVGGLDQVSFWNRALTGTDVQELYDCELAGTDINTCTTPVSAVNIITLTLKDNVTGSSIGSNVKFSNVTGELTFTYFNVTASGFCVSYTGNGTGTNCTTSGSGTSTYYNVTTTQNITGTQSVSEDTYQALLAVRSTRLYLNTTITSFNVTNNKALNTTTSGLVFLKASNGSNNVMVEAAGNYSKNATATVVSPFTITNLTVTGIYDNLFTFKANDLINGGLVSNFTIVAENATVATVTDTTTTRNVTLQLLQGYDYIAQFQSSTHAWQNATLPANASTNTYTFNAYTINSVNFSFYDEDTNTLITQLVTLEYIGDTESGNASTTSGHLYIDLLTPDTYTLRYNSAGYTQRFYELTIRNTTFTALNLTLLNATRSTNVTLTVRDTLDNLIEGAVVKILKYNLADNDYDITQIVTTNFEGVALADIELNTEYYRFIVEYNGEVVLSTNPSYIYGTSLTLIVDLIADSGFQNAETYYGYSGSITYLNTTEQLRFTYNDDTNTASKGCLYLYKLTSTRTLYNTSCSSSSSGTVYVTVRNSTGLYWQAEGYITDSGGTSHLVDSYTLSFRRLLPETGNGLFLMLLVLMVFGLIGVWRVDVAVLLGSLTPLLFTIIGFIQLDYVYTVPIFVLGVVTALILAVKQ